MQKPIAILAVLILVAAVLLLWQPWAGTMAPRSPAAVDPTAADDVTAPPAPPPEQAVGDATQPARIELPPLPGEPAAPRTGPVLRLVDGETRAPVASADVLLLQQDSLTAAQRAEIRALIGATPSFLTILERFGERFVTDRDGTVRLPAIGGRAIAVGRQENLRGVLRLEAGADGEFVLELVATHPLRVAVVDADNAPAPAVPIDVVVRRQEHWRSVWSGVTDPNGGVTIDGALDMSRLLAPEAADVPTGQAEVRISLPLREPPRAEVDLSSPPAEPIVLRLPPLGAVIVTLVHQRPELLETATVTLTDLDAPAGNQSNVSHGPRVENGRAAFPHVGLGLRLRATARLRGSTDSWTTDFDGPIAPGRTSSVRLELLERHPVIVAVLRDQDGTALGEASFKVKLQAEHGGSSSSSFSGTQSDADARVRIPIADDLAAEAERTLQIDSAAGHVVKMTLPILQPGENDLGVLTLRSAPLVCGGIVQDRAGKPIAKATVEVEHKEVYDPSRADGFYWNSSDLENVRTGDDGRFELSGQVGAEEHAISIRCDGYLPISHQPFVVGAAGLVFVLDDAARLAGRVVLAESVPRRMIKVEVVDAGGSKTSREPDGDGGFAFHELFPGIVDVRVNLFGDAEPLVSRTGISVRPGTTTKLDDIDLRDLLRTVAFRVVDASDRPVDKAVALLPDRGDGAERGGLFLDRGHGKALTRRQPLDLLVYADGYRNVHVTDVQDGQRIVLTPDFEVTISLGAEIAPPPAGIELRAHLEPIVPPAGDAPRFRVVSANRTSSFSGSVPWLARASGSLDASGRAQLRVPEPGEYRLVWSVARSGSNSSRGLGDAADERLVVADRAGSQVYTARLTAAAIAAATAGLK